MNAPNQTLPAFDETELTASLCRDSFYEFVKEFWSTVVPEKPVWNWHIKFLCDEMQEIAERVFQYYCGECDKDIDAKWPNVPHVCPHCQATDIQQSRAKKNDLIINVPPGSTKSTICSVMFPPWTWTRMPSARHIGGAFAQTLSQDLGRRAKDVFTSQKYAACYPDIYIRKDQSAKSYFMNNHGGSVRRTTVGSVIVGEHAHFLGVDDPLDPEGARSDADIVNASTWCTETISQRKVNQKISVMTLVMQRLHQDDPTGFILELAKGGKWPVRHICLPATRSRAVKPARLRKFYSEEGLFDPKRLPQDVLEEKKELGQFMYAGQYDQNPVPLGGGMFKVDRLKYDVPPPMRKFNKLVRYWDKAATAGGGAYTAGVLLGELLVREGNKRVPQYWILHVERGQWDTDQRESIIDMWARRDPKKTIIGVEDEGGSTGKDVALMTVRRHIGRRLVMHKPTGDKVLRADPISVQVNGHNVMIAKYGDDRDGWIHPFIEEMRYFPMSKYKDQMDGLSGGFALIWSRKRIGGMR